MKKLLLATIFVLTSIFTFSQSNCTTISDGTYGNTQTTPTSPVYGLYDYGWSSTIYYPANIGSAKTISSISWYVDGFNNGSTVPYTFSNVKIYFAYTTLSEWSSVSNVSGQNRLIGINVPQGITSWTKVYDGSITFSTKDAWKYITLDSPFSYNGTSNLVVHVENWDGSWASGYPVFHYTNAFSSSGVSVRLNKWAGQDGSMGPTTAPTRTNDKTDIQFCELVSLPIELLYFKGSEYNSENILNWSTASEDNNDYFTIEKTKDGIDWIVVNREPGAGNSSNQLYYSFVDENIESIINYYRLKQTDYDGKFKYSDIISIDNRNNNSKEIYKIINVLGQEIDLQYYRGLIIIEYMDGTSIKIIK